MILIIIGIVMVIIGLYNVYKFFVKLFQLRKMRREYSETIGTVVYERYEANQGADLVKAVTPGVEYEVEGKKHKVEYGVHSSDNSLPVGTKVKVLYDKNDPENAIIKTDIDFVFFPILIAIFCLSLGIAFIFIG